MDPLWIFVALVVSFILWAASIWLPKVTDGLFSLICLIIIAGAIYAAITPNPLGSY